MLKNTFAKWGFKELISLIVVVGCFAWIFIYSFSEKINLERGRNLEVPVFGLLTVVLTYWVGSSIGSSKKQEQLDKISDQQPINVGNIENVNNEAKAGEKKEGEL